MLITVEVNLTAPYPSAKLKGFFSYTRVQNVWFGWPDYEVKCLCSKGQECKREGSHSHQLFNI